MSSVGPNNPGTAADDASGGTQAWFDVNNALTQNGSYAYVDGTKYTYSHYLNLTNFSFSIPTGATINGVTAIVRRAASSSGITDNTIQLIKGGVRSGSSKADVGTNWPTSLTDKSYGGAADLWGNTLGPSDVNATNFGISIQAFMSGNVQARVDVATLTIYYTLPPQGMPVFQRQTRFFTRSF